MNNLGTKLTLKVNNTTVTWESEFSDCNLEDLFQAFEGLLVAHTFPQDSVRGYIIDLGEEYQELNDYKEKHNSNETED